MALAERTTKELQSLALRFAALCDLEQEDCPDVDTFEEKCAEFYNLRIELMFALIEETVALHDLHLTRAQRKLTFMLLELPLADE